MQKHGRRKPRYSGQGHQRKDAIALGSRTHCDSGPTLDVVVGIGIALLVGIGRFAHAHKINPRIISRGSAAGADFAQQVVLLSEGAARSENRHFRFWKPTAKLESVGHSRTSPAGKARL